MSDNTLSLKTTRSGGQALYTIRLAWRAFSGTPLLLARGTGCPVPLSPFPMPDAFQRQAFCQISLGPGGLTAKALRPSTGRPRAVQSQIFSASPKKLLFSSTLCQVFFENFLFVFYAWIHARNLARARVFQRFPLKISILKCPSASPS